MDNTTTTEIKNFPAARVGAARKAIAQAQARIERAARKANQEAPAAPVLTVVREFIRAECDTCGANEQTDPVAHGISCEGKLARRRVADLTVTYARPVLDGWEFLAVVEPLTGGNLLRGVPGATVVDGELDAWRTSDLRCDHCNTIRRRSETFIVRNEERTYKQVGRQCLAHFLGGKSAAAIIAALGWPNLIRAAGDGEGSGGGSDDPVYTPGEILAQTAACVRLGGWVSKGMARDREGLEATADFVLYLVNPCYDREESAKRKHREACVKFAVTDADVARADAARAWAVNLSGSDYERNLSLVASQEIIERSHVGILASAIASYGRFLGEQRTREERPTSAHVGTVGEKIDLAVTIERTFNVETQYGTLVINTMRTDEGAIIVWKTGKAVGSVGVRITIRGTVKRHSEYKGEAQTELTRCKVAEISMSASA